VDLFEHQCYILRDAGYFETRRQKEIESILQAQSPAIQNMKLCDTRTKSSPADWEGFQQNLEKELSRIGDKKLANSAEVAESFTNVVKSDTSKTLKSSRTDIEHAAKFFGIPTKLINDQMTIGELGTLGVFIEKMNIISKPLGCDTDTLYTLPWSKMPSWWLWLELEKRIRKEVRASGSNVTDKYLAPLAFYVDIIIVDKRIAEYFQQIQRAYPKEMTCANTILKVPHYYSLTSAINTV